ncbi:MAG: hypothetical protein ACHP7N_14830 [Caulobacterales bacterium]
MRNLLMGAACALAFGVVTTGTAIAAPTISPAGYIDASYTYLDLGTGEGSGHGNVWGVDGGGQLPFGSSFVGQLDGSYHNLSGSGAGNVDLYSVAGSVAWTPMQGRLGVAVSYTGASTHGATLNATSYGVFGEYYGGDKFTVGLKGGGASVSGGAEGFGIGSGSTTLGYVGAMAIFYPMDQLALSGNVDWAGQNGTSVTTVGVQGEWLFSKSTPFSGFINYNYVDFGSGVHANTVGVGVRYYFGGGMGGLVDHQRQGADLWGPQATGLRLLF